MMYMKKLVKLPIVTVCLLGTGQAQAIEQINDHLPSVKAMEVQSTYGIIENSIHQFGSVLSIMHNGESSLSEDGRGLWTEQSPLIRIKIADRAL